MPIANSFTCILSIALGARSVNLFLYVRTNIMQINWIILMQFYVDKILKISSCINQIKNMFLVERYNCSFILLTYSLGFTFAGNPEFCICMFTVAKKLRTPIQ